MTEEYFGETLREEDYIKYETERGARDLTKDEAVFLTWLARYTLFLDKSLFFQVGDLMRHTKLVLSGEPAERYEFPRTDELEKEIEELQRMIEEIEDELRRDELSQDYWRILDVYKDRLQKLKEAREQMEKSSPRKIRYLGKYIHNHGEVSKAILYVNNIEECAKNPHDTMLLMAHVLLHEYFHSFYYHVGVAVRNCISCIEEPLAEYGSLVVLDSVKSSGSPKAKEAGEALTYAYEFVKAKQKCTGTTAAYGFGAYIFASHKEDYFSLIPRYANLSRLLDGSDLKVKEYKYLVYPVYPLSLEEYAYKLLRDYVFVWPSAKRKITAGGFPVGTVEQDSFFCRFAFKVFKHLEDKGLIDNLKTYLRSGKSGFAIYDKGRFQLGNILYKKADFPTRPPKTCDGLLVIDGEEYYLSNHNWSDGSTHNHLEELSNMLECVYPGRFEIKKKVDEKESKVKEYYLIDKAK